MAGGLPLQSPDLLISKGNITTIFYALHILGISIIVLFLNKKSKGIVEQDGGEPSI